MTKEKSITFIVPAYNEEKNLAATINAIYGITHKTNIDNFEILIINDNSTDKTKEIADNLAKKHKHIKAFHNETNKGLGYNFKKGVQLSQKNYITTVPGDNEVVPSTICDLINAIGKADLIIPYHGNMQDRPLLRRIFSRTFTLGINLLFFLRLRYYNDPVIHKAEVIKKYTIHTNSFAHQVEAIVKSKKDGYSHYHVPMKLQETGRRSSAFKPKRVISLLKDIAHLAWEIHIEKTILRDNQKLKPLARQFTKFCFIGLINASIDFLFYLTLTRIFNIHFIVANLCAFVIAVTSSFLMNKKWTFRDTGEGQAKKYIKFIITNLIGIGINTTILYCLVTYLGFYDIIAKIIAIFLTTFWNFSASRYWTFKK
ncbi:bifunctional glycosyltransferase family 2/GtrA family protein [Patescibacteria group bacterium]|nr:bifunctional glycosyltransferase family 2/GtrA family protein [Patescibacteria group bacterium]MBU4511784.1 bifunctional glycosyltransferase family 2/GtrA family protein [Patescibacteria group bacterium]